MINEPKHHRRYRVAWEAYVDPDTPDHCKKALHIEMDSAQDDFEWNEFQRFKVTLDGFEEFWTNWATSLIEAKI